MATEPNIIRTAFKYRAYCNKTTQSQAIFWMVCMANVWNAALEERQKSFEVSKNDPSIKPINHKFGQYHQVKRSEHPEFGHINILALQATLAKLHDSYRSFFALTKKDPLSRPPKEKGIHRIIELGRVADKPFGWTFEGNILSINGLGRFKLRLHRPVEGKIKTVTVSLKAGKWYVCFSCEVILPIFPERKKRRCVKLFFEDNIFIRDSTGNVIEHPRFYFSEIDRLRRLSRSLSRKKKGSKNRKKAKYTLTKWHEHIAHKRKYFLESIACYYTKRFDLIEIPKMPLKQKIMQSTTSRKAMTMCDSAYGLFTSILKHSGKKNGVEIMEYAL